MQEHNELVQTDSNEIDTIRLQPMGFTDILDGMFSLYRDHFQLFLAIAAVYFALGVGVDLIFVSLMGTSGVSSLSIMMAGFTAIFNTVVSILVTAGLAYASALIYLGREIAPGPALQQAWRRFWQYFGSGLLMGFAVLGLFVSIVGIPFGIYFLVRWGLYTLPVLFEETTVRNALRRSTELVKGTWWRVCGIMLAIFLISFMITFILGVSFEFLLSWIGVAEPVEPSNLLERVQRLFMPTLEGIGWFSYTIRRLIDMGLVALTMPIGVIGSTLLYFDLRIRKEAYDIEVQVTN